MKEERIRYEMFLRVRDFGAAHSELFHESSAGAESFARLGQVVSQMEEHAIAKQLAAKDGRTVKTAARAAVRKRMLAIARTARRVAVRVPGVENKLQLPRLQSDAALLTAARTFLREVEPVANKLVHLGLPSTFLKEFTDAVSVFDNAIAGRRAGRAGVAAGQAGIDKTIAEAFDIIRTLDVAVANTLEDNSVLLAAWKRDRRVMLSPTKSDPTPASAPAGEATDQATPDAGRDASPDVKNDALPKAS